MRRTTTITILILVAFFCNGCYTKLNLVRKTSPQTWQKKHRREIIHTNNVSCHRWNYYYHYPYWMSLSADDSEQTGFDRFVSLGAIALWGFDIAWDIMNIWTYDDDDSFLRKRKESPEKRKSDDNDDSDKNDSKPSNE